VGQNNVLKGKDVRTLGGRINGERDFAAKMQTWKAKGTDDEWKTSARNVDRGKKEEEIKNDWRKSLKPYSGRRGGRSLGEGRLIKLLGNQIWMNRQGKKEERRLYGENFRVKSRWTDIGWPKEETGSAKPLNV